MASRSVTGSNTGLSFLDVLAGAVGAVVLLFIAFAALPVSKGAKAPRGGSFIRMEWTVQSDPSALVRLLVRPPLGISKPPYGSAREGPFFVGLKGLSHDPQLADCRLPGTLSHSFLGFESSERPAARLSNENFSIASLNRSFVLRLHYPMAGKWQIDLVYFDRADGLSTPPTVLNVTTESAWSRGSATGPVQRLYFAESLPGPVIDVAGSEGAVPTNALKPECDVEWLEVGGATK